MKDKTNKNCGIALLIIGGISMYASGDPEGAGTFLGAVERARRPRTRIVRRRNGLFGSYTETVYV